ncbi:hypothetical protein MP228_002654 [Amoeboaphelidium protococcarum]|nr:hypothetical protein MP228_002654 [Amoeboaphelidium protococcarum]
MVMLWIMSWLTIIGGGAFFLLCLACGLYYLTELIEEYTVQTRKVLQRIEVSIILLHILLMISGSLPFIQLSFSLMCQIVYALLLLPKFPYINMTDVSFVISMILVIANHFWWFHYFGLLQSKYFEFSEICSVFAFLVWLVPFIFFISLSAGDQTLPYTSPGGLTRHDTDYTSTSPSSYDGIDSNNNNNKKRNLRLNGMVRSWLNEILRVKDDFLRVKSSKSSL